MLSLSSKVISVELNASTCNIFTLHTSYLLLFFAYALIFMILEELAYE